MCLPVNEGTVKVQNTVGRVNNLTETQQVISLNKIILE